MTLARWTYTKEEWKAFLRTTKKNNSIFAQFLHFFLPAKLKSAPVVTITPERVWIGNDQQYFSSERHVLTKIRVAEVEAVNILAITYEEKGGATVSAKEIRIPVPKGRLREAIEVEQKLMGVHPLIQPG